MSETPAPPVPPVDPAGEAVDAAVRTAEAVSDIKRKTAAGMVLVGVRSLAILGLGVVGSVVLARLLTPHDFGIVALGYVVMNFASFLTDGGLGGSLIRGAEEPERADYANAFGFQLAVSLVLLAGVAAVGSQLGRGGLFAVVMVASLPLVSVRTPGAVAMERHLDYRPLIFIEVGETITYYGWAIVTAILGWGVWALASAVLVRALAGSVIMLVAGPIGLLRPRLSRRRVSRLLGFGISYQAVNVVGLLRDQGLNLFTSVLASVTTLGLWTLVVRVMQPPMVVFSSLRRVSYPGMARLRDHGEDPRPTVERALVLGSVGAGLVLAPLAASAPALIPAVFGARWTGAAAAIPPECLGLLVASPFSVACAGYLYAEGRANETLRIVVYGTVTWFAVTVPLLPIVGVAALGIGQLAAGVAEAALFGNSMNTHIPGIRPTMIVAAPIAIATIGAGIGWVGAWLGPHTMPVAAASALLAMALVLIGTWLVRKSAIRDLWWLTRRAVGASVS